LTPSIEYSKILILSSTVVKFQEDQYEYNRIALVYFVHPHDSIIREHLRLEQERRKTLERTNLMSGQEINRLIMALSADNEDEYAKIVNGDTWLRVKSGELIAAPEELSFDYEARTIRRRVDAEGNFAKIIGGVAPQSNNTAMGNSQSFTEEQWRTIQAIARVMAKEKVAFSDDDWKKALAVLNRGLLGSGAEVVQDVESLSPAQGRVLEQALGDLLAKPTPVQSAA
jgi:hypothetical protein